MQTAGARALREDDNEMSREAVLLQWERKVEVADSRDSGRFVRSADEERSDVERRPPIERRPPADAQAPLTEDATKPVPRRFERPAGGQPGRRTITITGQPTQPRRRAAIVEARLAQPDRIALWAFVLGLILVAVAAGTAHA
jgi:hypothetical protein